MSLWRKKKRFFRCFVVDEAHVAHLIESISLKEHEFLSGLKVVAFLA